MSSISALCCTHSNIYAGSLAGHIYVWSMEQVKRQVVNAHQVDDIEMDEMCDSTPQLLHTKKLDFGPSIGSINDMAYQATDGLAVAHSKGLHLIADSVCQKLLDVPTLQIIAFDDRLAVLSPNQLHLWFNGAMNSYPVFEVATCFAKLGAKSVVIGFENSTVAVYSLEKFAKSWEVRHKINSPVRGICVRDNYILTALSGVGIFKWLSSNATNPETREENATLVKIMPTTKGFQINQMSQMGSELLVGMQDPHLLKYDSTLGYHGYYKSKEMSQIYAIRECQNEVGQPFACLVAGKPVSKVFKEQPQYEIEPDTHSESFCVELIQLATNSLLLRLQ